ncbi:tripartite tricarboxylate transporter substrate binding protein [Ramlibacter sp. G-1-2-2]|uniref:Tripartite tricarboxylate transporter substrate binding protein n=1 Tax=Ramlibacter agri TaxID=2728837 RepID=A0A848H0P9_9BURK|nr:tripartite tricarboxylate transporter substrate binding protein [Ramlibacter agri]NML44027.1 tripartite tricarboxylate transporter substrate binding protein [Ramlibacter agri]
MATPLSRRSWLHAACAASLLGSPFSSALAQAQDWPTKPVRMIVPFPAGTAPDVVARLLADKLSQGWKQGVVVENRPGAGAIPGMSAAARAEKDGYTLAFVPAAAATLTPYLYKNPQYNFDTDFVPVAAVGTSPLMVVVNASSGIHSLADLAKAGKAAPGKMNFAAGQLNSLPHLTGEMLSRTGSMSLFTVPYAGSPAAVTSLLAGDSAMTIDGLPSLVQYVKAGKLRVIAVTSDKRLPGFEDVPAAAETYKGFEAIGWFGLFAPTGTPAAVVDQINRETNKALQNPDLVRQYADLGIYPRPGTPAALKEFVVQQQALFRGWIRELGLQAQ